MLLRGKNNTPQTTNYLLPRIGKRHLSSQFIEKPLYHFHDCETRRKLERVIRFTEGSLFLNNVLLNSLSCCEKETGDYFFFYLETRVEKKRLRVTEIRGK